jgi:hypothetical protein
VARKTSTSAASAASMVEQIDVVTGRPGPPVPRRETDIEFISNPTRFWRGSNEWPPPAMHNRQKRDRGCTTINPGLSHRAVRSRVRRRLSNCVPNEFSLWHLPVQTSSGDRGSGHNCCLWAIQVRHKVCAAWIRGLSSNWLPSVNSAGDADEQHSGNRYGSSMCPPALDGARPGGSDGSNSAHRGANRP